jgi:hypothetical protein
LAGTPTPALLYPEAGGITGIGITGIGAPGASPVPWPPLGATPTPPADPAAAVPGVVDVTTAGVVFAAVAAWTAA